MCWGEGKLLYHGLTPQVPPFILPKIQRSGTNDAPIPHPIQGKGPVPRWKPITGSRFVKLPTALPLSLLLPAPPSPFPPQGDRGPACLPRLCLPICLHPKMNPGSPPASGTPPEDLQGGPWAPHCLPLTLGKGPGMAHATGLPGPAWPTPPITLLAWSHALPSELLRASSCGQGGDGRPRGGLEVAEACLAQGHTVRRGSSQDVDLALSLPLSPPLPGPTRW